MKPTLTFFIPFWFDFYNQLTRKYYKPTYIEYLINYEGQITCAYTNAKVLIYRYKNALNMKLSFLSGVVTMEHIYDNTKTFRYHVQFVLTLFSATHNFVTQKLVLDFLDF